MWGISPTPGLGLKPALPLACHVTLGRTLQLIGYQFSHLYNMVLGYIIPKVLSSGDIPLNNKIIQHQLCARHHSKC